MQVGRIGKMIGSIIPGGGKYVMHTMHILHRTPQLSLLDICVAVERITGPLNAQELLTMAETLEALKEYGYVAAERLGGYGRIFRLTPDGCEAVFPIRATHSHLRDFVSMEDPLRRPL